MCHPGSYIHVLRGGGVGRSPLDIYIYIYMYVCIYTHMSLNASCPEFWMTANTSRPGGLRGAIKSFWRDAFEK